MGLIGSLNWLLIEIISFLWQRKLLIDLINFLFKAIDVNLKRNPLNQTWSEAFSTSRKMPVVEWPIWKSNFIVSNSLDKFSLMLLFFFVAILLIIEFFVIFCPVALVIWYSLFQKFTEVGCKTKRSIASYQIFRFTSFM